MSKLRVLAQKCAYTVATAATKGGNTVATLFSQSGSTVATLHDTLSWLFSRLKTPFNGLVSGSSGNTSPNFAQEHEKEGYGRILVDDREPIYHDPYSADEFDHEDYDEWWEDNYEEWWDGAVYNRRGTSWQQQAVDEAVDEEEPGQYPPGMQS